MDGTHSIWESLHRTDPISRATHSLAGMALEARCASNGETVLVLQKRWIFAVLSIIGPLLVIFGIAEASLRWIFPPAGFPGDRVLASRFHMREQNCM